MKRKKSASPDRTADSQSDLAREHFETFVAKMIAKYVIRAGDRSPNIEKSEQKKKDSSTRN